MSEQAVPSTLFDDIPKALHRTVSMIWQRWCDACTEQDVSLNFDAIEGDFSLADLGYVFACSDYVARTCIKHPATLLQLLDDGLEQAMTLTDYHDELDAGLRDDPITDMTRLRKLLRVFRHRHTLRIALRDLLRVADIDTLLREQSELAAAIIDGVTVHLQNMQHEVLGVPRDEAGREQRLVVLAMGKLGGYELNFSSDIDLIFCYPEDGNTDGRGSLSNHEFFIRTIRELMPTLDDTTEDSFVYRVDTRLRPYGKSGPLAMSFTALENYYQSQGREWERYAMIKARAVSGQREDIDVLTHILRPFVYRRYLDFSVFAGIREMKSMIEEQVRRKSMQGNIKLGAGGIREIEFIGQTFQLIRGGRDGRLQTASIVKILKRLAELEILGDDDVAHLIAAYRYLREMENRIQIEGDQQKHSLPDDELMQHKLQLAMRCDSWQQLLDQLKQHSDHVSRLFASLIEQDEAADSRSSADLFTLMQNYFSPAQEHTDAVQEDLRSAMAVEGIQISDEELALLDQFRSTPAFQHASSSAREQCARLVGSLLIEIEDEHARFTMKRLIAIIQAVLGRPVYLSMMAQYQGLRQRLIWLCQSGEWFTEQIKSMPILLDELIESDVEHSLPSREQLKVELDTRISAVPEDDQEMVLDSLRVFKQSNVFRVAMLDVVAAHKVTDLADRISDIAELLVQKTLQLSWNEIAKRHGEPGCVVDGERQRPGITVIGYGKMGGAELGYGSDLDVVFIHNSRGEQQVTDGDRQLDNSAFFAKVVQRFLHLMSTRTFSGVLYEIDTRLRPDGGAGLMVTSTDAFDKYQQDRAWTWEHQALIRARAVAGDHNAAQEFDRIRCSVLAKPREWASLAKDVVEMRNKMRGHLASKGGDANLKQDAGGLVDIEFIAQAGVLQLAASEAALLKTTATILLLAILGKVGWLTEAEVAVLSGAYVALRRAHNYESLGVDNAALIEQCRVVMPDVSAVWNRLFAEFE